MYILLKYVRDFALTHMDWDQACDPEFRPFEVKLGQAIELKMLRVY